MFDPAEGKFGRLSEGICEPPDVLCVPEALITPDTVILPLGIPLGSPEVIPDSAAAPRLGSCALGSTVHALAPLPEVGQAGAVVLTVAA